MFLKHCGLILVLCCAVGCSSDRSLASVQYLPASAVSGRTPTVTLTGAGMRRLLSGVDLGLNGANMPTSVETPTSGSLIVTFTLDDGAGASVSAGVVSVDLRPDWAWAFVISVDSTNPKLSCFGCAGARAFPLAAQYQRTRSDSVWVSWGGNSITHPVVY